MSFRARALGALSALWLLAPATTPGCYAPQIGNGTLGCSDGGLCPSGFTCGVYRRCWRPGTEDGGAKAGADARDGVDRAINVGDSGRDAATGAAGRTGTGGKGGTGGTTARDAAVEAPGDGPRKPLGAACGAGTECSSGFCTDGVCCQSACSGSCEACNLAPTAGVCTNVPNGGDPPPDHTGCSASPPTECLADGKCDGRGNCRTWDNVVCAPARCDPASNVITLQSLCNGSGACVSGPSASCAPFVCASGGAACLASCTSSTDCTSGNSCTQGSCGKKPLAAPCAAGAECASGLCVDSVCCDGACTGACEACDTAAAPGHCSAVSSGQPHRARPACGGTGLCAGACAAASRSTCTFPPNTSACGSQSCSGHTLTPVALCDGAGACVASTAHACGADLVCNDAGTACLTACRSDGDCLAPTPYCAGSACTAAAPDGLACTSDGQCQSGQCVDGVCCDRSCTDPCQACDVTGHLGSCWPIPSHEAPHSPRAACSGSGVCAGVCNGSAATCFFPGSETACPCTLLSGTCNGAGQCGTLGNVCL